MNTIYEDKYYIITQNTFQRKGGSAFPLGTIQSVSSPRKEDFEITGFLVNSLIVFVGLWAISALTIEFIIGGLIALAIGGFNVWSQFNRRYFIVIDFNNAKQMPIYYRDISDIQNLYSALMEAIG